MQKSPGLGLTDVTSLEIWTDLGRNSGVGFEVSLDGGTGTPLQTVSTGWVTVPNLPSTIDTLRVTTTG